MTSYRADSDPRVSVLVLAYRHLGVVDAVAALTASAPTATYEVRVLLNGASRDVIDAVRGALPAEWIEESRANLGFAAGMNRLAAGRSSEFIVMLNDDATVTRGWLDALVAAADQVPEAAAVTGRLYYPDGRLQEAGARLTLTGNGVQAGNGLSAAPPELMVRRPIDFASCSAALVRRRAFDQVGGFDERYYPAYYEDADLSLRLREAGWSVMYDPAPVAVHAQGQSSTDEDKVTFASYAREVFLGTWGGMFSTCPEDNLVVPDEPIPPRGPGGKPVANPDNSLDALGLYTSWLNRQLALHRAAVGPLDQQLEVVRDQVIALEAELTAARANQAATADRAAAESATVAAMASTMTWRLRTASRAAARSAVDRARRLRRRTR
jgi:GT2 family glycosyltransferase